MVMNSIAIMDTDERYAMNISALLMESLSRNVEILTFTCMDKLYDYLSGSTVNSLVITQTAFREEILRYPIKTLILLEENADPKPEGVVLINRFQSGEEIKKEILSALESGLAEQLVLKPRRRRWKVLGVYSPIHRSLQTSFALTLGQMLSADKKTLYMNFENFSGLSGWFEQEFKADVIDILYYLDCDKDKLINRIPLVVHSIGQLDILPPAASYFDTYDRTGEKWLELFTAIEETTDYEYLILDLSDAMQGLLQVMGYCDRIYTLIRRDNLSDAKLEQYEKWMMDHSYTEIIKKSMRFKLPEFTWIPDNPHLLTKSELVGYVNAVIREDEEL